MYAIPNGVILSPPGLPKDGDLKELSIKSDSTDS